MLVSAIASTLLLLTSGVLEFDLENSPKTRIHLKSEGGELKVTVYQERRFASEAALIEWLGSQKRDKREPIVLQVDEKTKFATAYAFLKTLTKRGYSNIELAVPKSHEKYIKSLGEGFESKQMISFGGWLSGYYEKEFGERAIHFMWKDLNRALLERKAYLAANLIFSMPEQSNAGGKKTCYARTSPGAALDDRAVVHYLDFILAEDGEFQKMLIDELATINERRATQFLLDYLADESNPFYSRSAAIRTLNRLRTHGEAIASQTGMFWLMYYKDTPETRKRMKKDLEALTKWWQQARGSFGKQLFATPR